MSKTILAWNVNGIRAAARKGFLEWLAVERPDILAIQETKAMPNDLGEELRAPDGYRSAWNSAVRKGYSGVAVYFREEPLNVHHGLGVERFDTEGRTLILEWDDLVLFNIYFPNGKQNAERLAFKLDFYRAFFDVAESWRSSGKTILCVGDFNTAHREIDLARPKENSTVSGFLPEERALIDAFIDKGFIDTLREFHPEPELYSWWDLKSRARERNVGWRIDYLFIDRESRSRLDDGFILADVQGSDHCPVGVRLK